MKRHALRAGENLAIQPDAVQRDAAGFFVLLEPPPDNERRGSVCVVHVRGALSQFKTEGGDSYEAIEERVKCGIEADPKPSAIILKIHSPGGVVAGLNESVFKLQKMSKAAGVPIIAYICELAASAGFALCCACSERIAPPSAVIGSVGTIATMGSQAAADKAMGLDVRLIVSGKRKADGHIHAPITDDAVKAETARNEELAAQFFALASKATGVSTAKLESLEAAIYLAKDAKRVGLIDDVMSFDEVVFGLDTTETPPPVAAPNEGNITDRRATPLDRAAQRGPHSAVAQPGTPREAPMLVRLAALIKRTEEAIKAETDPKKLATLQAQLAAFAATRAEMGDDEDDDKKKGDEDDEDSKAKRAEEAAKKAARKAEGAKHRARAAEFKQKAAEAEEEAKKAEEDEEEARYSEGSEEARLSAGAAAALAGDAAAGREALKIVQQMRADTEKRDHASMIDGALAARRITPSEAKLLRGKAHGFVKDFLDMRPNAIVNVSEGSLRVPDGTPAGDLSADVMAAIDVAIQSGNYPEPEKMREKMITAHRERMAKANGAASGRY